MRGRDRIRKSEGGDEYIGLENQRETRDKETCLEDQREERKR